MGIASAARSTIGAGLTLVAAACVGASACEPVPGTGTDAGVVPDAGGSAGAALVPIGADGLCRKLVGECGLGLTESLCLSEYFPLRVTAACASAIPAATCADLSTTSSSVSQTCFPPCSAGTAPSCNGDGTITLCTTSNTKQVHDCRDSCTANGFISWTGACGTTFDGQVSAQAQCWCR